MTFSTFRAVRAAARFRSVAAEILVFVWASGVLGFSLLIMMLSFAG
jgi:UPF0716 family protein affecting phage T7 exclusion